MSSIVRTDRIIDSDNFVVDVLPGDRIFLTLEASYLGTFRISFVPTVFDVDSDIN